jgi:SAM-dependent methyltransferase
MPSVDENRATWGGTYEWNDEGDEWSKAWGGAENQWNASLLPRILPFVPAKTILEIAPGYGRWTQFLLPQCERFIGIDLVEGCITHCRTRFAAEHHAEFHTNDGTSLALVADNSIDFCFSYDSLVHAEADVLAGYLRELASKLTPDGVALIHHSNLGADVGGAGRAVVRNRRAAAEDRARRWVKRHPRLVTGLKRVLSTDARDRISPVYWRAESMSAEKFVAFARDAGLTCIGQELINWYGSTRLLDCISIAVRPGSVWDRRNVIARNPHFMSEAASARRRAPVFNTLQGAHPDATRRASHEPEVAAATQRSTAGRAPGRGTRA